MEPFSSRSCDGGVPTRRADAAQPMLIRIARNVAWKMLLISGPTEVTGETEF
jgi:hypothetical protein